jgi:hypothetical protein
VILSGDFGHSPGTLGLQPRDACRAGADLRMGCRLAGFLAVEQGTLRFTGTLVTRGGGFTSAPAAPRG